MKRLVVLVGLVAVVVLATAALSGNAGENRTAGDQARLATLQQQVNELRSELVCLEAVAGDGYAQDWWIANNASSTTASKPQSGINDRGVCAKLGVKQVPPTDSSAVLTQPFTQLIGRAFGR